MISRSQTTQTRRVCSLTPEQPVIPQCGATARKERSRYYPPCTTRTQWHFSRLLVDLATKTD
ncbi:unnamed protein product [Hymenolepis diminuta]|uniref:Uncharacterized protein n=1 Tax=Hymenolepis diminuta TaxID=6216 RepID=A0A564YP17_HYMDI|nr:unnamed protein product [Hymenolepis diminuta]